MDLREANSVSEYLSKYEECCNVGRKPELTLAEKVFGEKESAYVGDFSVEIIVQKKNPGTRRYATALYFIDGCGEIIERHEIDRQSLEVE